MRFLDNQERAREGGPDNWNCQMITGSVDLLSNDRVSGWAFNVDDPTEHVKIAVYSNGSEAASGVADIFRPDLAGKFGDGDHSFRIDLPDGLLQTELAVRAITKNGRQLALLGTTEAVREADSNLASRIEALEERVQASEVFLVRLDEMMRKIVEAEKKKRKKWLGLF